jgi:hypothetical protein
MRREIGRATARNTDVDGRAGRRAARPQRFQLGILATIAGVSPDVVAGVADLRLRG